MLLNDYLSKHVEMFQGCTAIELGSGVGMYSLLKIIIITYVYTFYVCGRNNSSLKCP